MYYCVKLFIDHTESFSFFVLSFLNFQTCMQVSGEYVSMCVSACGVVCERMWYVSVCVRGCKYVCVCVRAWCGM